MAYLYRLTLALLLVLFAGSASAVPPITYYPENSCNAATYASWTLPAGATRTWMCGHNPATPRTCGWLNDRGTFKVFDSLCELPAPLERCPDNSAKQGADCVCFTNYVENGGQCVRKPIECPAGQHLDGAICVPDKCPDGQILVAGVCAPDPDICPDGSKKVNGKCPEQKCKVDDSIAMTMAANMPTAVCHKNCLYSTGGPNMAVACSEFQGVRRCAVTYYGLGTVCSGSDGSNSGPANGGTGGTGGDGSGGTGGTGGDGSGGTGGTGGTGGNSGGSSPNGGSDKPTMPSTSPDDEGKCPPGTYKSGGKCFPNENVTTQPDGTGTCPEGYTRRGEVCVGNKPLPDEQGDKDFCKENPTLDACKTGSFTGSCKANFTCEGDAIQCSMAREQHIRNCQLFDADIAERGLYNDNKGKQGKQTGDLPGNEEINVSGRIDKSDALGGGSCMPDFEVMVMGFSVTIPLMRVCPYLIILGNFLMAVSMLIGIRIALRG